VRAEAHTVDGVVRALSRGLAVSLDEVTVQTAAAIKAAHR
jgi:hypothetical protein